MTTHCSLRDTTAAPSFSRRATSSSIASVSMSRCARLVADRLEDDLDIPGLGLKLNVFAVRVHLVRQRTTERGAPEAGLRQQVVGPAIDDDVPQSALVHCMLPMIDT